MTGEGVKCLLHLLMYAVYIDRMYHCYLIVSLQTLEIVRPECSPSPSYEGAGLATRSGPRPCVPAITSLAAKWVWLPGHLLFRSIFILRSSIGSERSVCYSELRGCTFLGVLSLLQIQSVS